MNYIKKMCILRQIKQGFSADGKSLSGLIKIEQYGKNLAVEISVINFAPLVSGEYYCLLSDGKGKTEMLALRGKSIFNILSDLDISSGFCGIICYVKNEVIPVAYGINGNGSYDWRAILNATLPPVFPQNYRQKPANESAESDATNPLSTPPNPLLPVREDPPLTDEPLLDEPTLPETPPTPNEPNTPIYNDEKVATENYYEEENNERKQSAEINENVDDQSATSDATEEEGADFSENDDAQSLLHPIKTDPDGYYLSVKGEIDELFSTYPKDETLCGAFSCSEWVRIKGTKDDPKYLVGVLYDDGRAKYVCYALYAEDKDNPPDEIKEVCTFVPVSAFGEEKGFFLLFQSATSGECIRPEQI